MYFAGGAKHDRSGLTLFSHYCKLGVARETMDLHCCKTSNKGCLGVPAGRDPASRAGPGCLPSPAHGEERGGQRWSCTTTPSGTAARLLEQHRPYTAAPPEVQPRAARCQPGVPSCNLPTTVPWTGTPVVFATKTKAATGLEAFGDENMSSPLLFCFCPISGSFKQVHSS